MLLKKIILLFFILNINCLWLEDIVPSSVRVFFLNRANFPEKVKKVKTGVFNYFIPYLLFLFTPIDFFKKNDATYDFNYILNQDNDYSYFDFIKVEGNNNIIFQNKGQIVENINSNLIAKYQKLVQFFLDTNIFVFIFVSWYCTVMDEETKIYYIGDGEYYFLNFFKSNEDLQNFDSIINCIEGKGEKMERKTILNCIKKCIKIFCFLNNNVSLKAPNSEDDANQQQSFSDSLVNENDKAFVFGLIDRFIDRLIDRLEKSEVIRQAVEVIKQSQKTAEEAQESAKAIGAGALEFKEVAEQIKKKVEETKIEEAVNDIRELMKKNGPKIMGAMDSATKAHAFLEDLRIKFVGFYCIPTNTSFPFHLSISLDWALLAKEKKVSIVLGLGFSANKMDFPILATFYLNSIFISPICYEVLFIKKTDLSFNGLSCFFFHSFFSLKRFKLFWAIRLSDHVRFSFGAAYIYEKF